MGRAEVGTPKYIANQMKAKGLQRLRWYCQVCEKQCRDENGFKCHTQSESHVRQMLLVGQNPQKKIEEYSRQFKHDFSQLLRTAHGEKKINANRFYQEYIQDKQHVHMNATRWTSLQEFVKYLGREGTCRVEDSEKDGLCISWIDNSPEALKRNDARREKERGDRGDEERTQKIIEKQIEQAMKGKQQEEQGSEGDEKVTELKRDEQNPVKLSLAQKPRSHTQSQEATKVAPIGLNAKRTTKPLNVFAVKHNDKVTKKKPVEKKPLNAFQRVMLKDHQLKRRI